MLHVTVSVLAMSGLFVRVVEKRTAALSGAIFKEIYMSNVVAFNPAQVPAFAKTGELSALAKTLAGGGGQSGKRISIKGGVFRLISDGKEVAAIEERYLDVVIVNAAPKISRTFYGEAYDSENPVPPDCWSADGEKPDPTAKAPQHVNCAGCPQNIKGSGQGGSRACRFSQRLAVVLANDVEGDVLQLTLPAQSIFGKEEGENRPLQAYARWLAAQSVGPDMVVTRMKFDTNAESPKLFFKPMRWLTDDEHETCAKQGQSNDAVKAITMTVAQVDKVEKPIALEGTAPKAKAKAKPKAEEADEEVDEPAVRKEKEAPAPKAKSNLANVVADWDTDD